MEFRELAAFVAIVEAGSLSAASRRLHVSQPSLTQMVQVLERELGVVLLRRSNTGVTPTDAGATLFAEARTLLTARERTLQMMANRSEDGLSVIRLGVPLEMPAELLSSALAGLVADHPETRVQPRHLSTAAQISALRGGELDVGLIRERPVGEEFDSFLVLRENLGVLLNTRIADEIAGPRGIPLERLGHLAWIGFPRSNCPAWYDELTAILRSHGIDPGGEAPPSQELTAPVKFAAISSGHAFALAPEDWTDKLPSGVTWSPLIGHPLVRRTWVAWPADSRRRDIGNLITAFDTPGPSDR